MQADWWEGFMKYVVDMGSGAMYTKFHKDWFRHSKADKGRAHRHTI
jgi:hypothetical protein